MLRSPLHALGRNRRHTAAMLIVLTLALALPGAAALTCVGAARGATEWLAGYRPVVYLAPEAGDDAVATLRAELEGWTTVASVTDRSPAEALAALEGRLGSDEVRELGITAATLPRSLILEPALPVAGHIDLVSRVAGLEARIEVASVDVPSSSALRALSLVRLGLVASLAMLASMLAAAAALLIAFLRGLERDERDELATLERLGATHTDLRRPTWIRGLALGLWSGLLAAGGLGVGVLVVQANALYLLGRVNVATGWSALVLAALVAIGPLVGLLAGLRASRRRIVDDPDTSPLRPLLLYDEESR